MNTWVNKEEFDAVRKRVNKNKQNEEQKYSKAGVTDDYTCTDVMERKGELAYKRQIEKDIKEVWE